ncbi:MAG: helix-turn-helix domain-containing protein, partial [Symploca sp. SIO1C4]|nr:helix-turn-helix domain-containing protein [Symploca sp. SIO1C4]
MTNDPIVFWCSCLLWLIVTALIVSSVSSKKQAEEKTNLKYDQLLQERLKQVSLNSWKDLCQKSGLSILQLHQVRRGEIGQLQLNQLQKLARALNWSLEDLIHNLGILSTTEQMNTTAVDTAEIEQLRQQCQQLQEELQQQLHQLRANERRSTFCQLQTLLTNYPTARSIVQRKPDLPAKNLVAILMSLDNLLKSWGYQFIGSVWEQVPYNPQLHQPDTDDIQPGELVYIRFVGYREG